MSVRLAQCCLCIVDFLGKLSLLSLAILQLHLTLILVYALACIIISRYEAPRKLGKQERDVRVAQGAAESNSSLLGALQTPQVLHI